MPSEKEIEAAARAICKADMVLPDELSMGSGKPRWTQYMRQAKAALQAAEAVRWLPIESAPKKEWCLVAAPSIPCTKVYIARFSEVNGCWWRDDLRTQVNSPTYWQPLPPTLPTPPTQAEEI